MVADKRQVSFGPRADMGALTNGKPRSCGFLSVSAPTSIGRHLRSCSSAEL